jgi:hypothetical protein
MGVKEHHLPLSAVVKNSQTFEVRKGWKNFALTVPVRKEKLDQN